MDLAAFVEANQAELIDLWRRRAEKKLGASSFSQSELDDNMPTLLVEIIAALRQDATATRDPQPHSPSANQHAAQRLSMGFDVQEIIREYGILHQAILDLAGDLEHSIDRREHRTLVRCLSNCVATAIGEYQRLRDEEIASNASKHIAFLAHELRNPLQAAAMGISIIRRGPLPESIATTAARVEGALRRLNEHIDHALTESRLKGLGTPALERIQLDQVITDVVRECQGEADDRGIRLRAEVATPCLEIDADARLLMSAVTNLVRNAIKFTRVGGTVTLRLRTLVGGRCTVDVEDECGGLPPGTVEELFTPFVQRGADRSGFGLGLAIAKQAVEAHRGTLHVRNLPNKGCEFTIDIPCRAC